MHLSTSLLTTAFAAFACAAVAIPAEAETLRTHNVRVTRGYGPALTYDSMFASPWSGGGWSSWDWPAASAWPSAGAGAWPSARAGAYPAASPGFSTAWADRAFAEMERDMAEMDRELDAMFGPIGWAGSAWPAAPSYAVPAAAPARIEMAPAGYPVAGAGYAPYPPSYAAYPSGYAAYPPAYAAYPSGYAAYPSGYASYPGYPVAAGATSGYSYSTQSYDDGRCVRTTTTTQTLGYAPQTATRTDGRC